MKLIDLNKCSKIAYYVYSLGQNLLYAKRNLRRLQKLNAPENFIEFQRGQELQAHNDYYGAKETFRDEIRKKYED